MRDIEKKFISVIGDKMKKKKKYPEIKPRYLTDAKGKKTQVYLGLDVYKSIIEELAEWKTIQKKLVKKKKTN